MSEKLVNLTDKALEGLPKITTLIARENLRQLEKWGVQTHSSFEWLAYTLEELGELSQAISEYEYRDGWIVDVVKEAVQTATLVLKIAEMYQYELDRIERIQNMSELELQQQLAPDLE